MFTNYIFDTLVMNLRRHTSTVTTQMLHHQTLHFRPKYILRPFLNRPNTATLRRSVLEIQCLRDSIIIHITLDAIYLQSKYTLRISKKLKNMASLRCLRGPVSCFRLNQRVSVVPYCVIVSNKHNCDVSITREEKERIIP